MTDTETSASYTSSGSIKCCCGSMSSTSGIRIGITLLAIHQWKFSLLILLYMSHSFGYVCAMLMSVLGNIVCWCHYGCLLMLETRVLPREAKQTGVWTTQVYSRGLYIYMRACMSRYIYQTIRIYYHLYHTDRQPIKTNSTLYVQYSDTIIVIL